MKNQNKKFTKFVSGLLLTAIFSASLGVLLFPQKSQAFIAVPGVSVPVEGAGGKFDKVTQITVDTDVIGNEIIRSAVVAVMNDAYRYFSSKLITSLEKKVGIKNLLNYRDALVGGKYLVDSLAKSNPAYQLPLLAASDLDRRVLQDITRVYGDYQGLRLNSDPSYTQNQAAAQAISDIQNLRPQDQQRYISKLIVGGTSAFTSSIICGGTDKKTLRNTTTYLAAASAGVLANQIDPAQGLIFYEQMARLGAPTSLPDFWTLQLQDNAATHEAKAKEAAALELVSPGIKASQFTNTTTGKTEVGRSVNVLTGSQRTAQQSIYDAGIFRAGNTLIPSNNFKSFLAYLAAKYAADQFSAFIGSLFGIIGKIIGADVENMAWLSSVKSYSGLVASVFTGIFVRVMYDDMIKLIFQGKILAESESCRQAALQTALNGFNPLSPSEVIPAFDSSDNDKGVLFVVSPDIIVRGDTNNDVTLFWNASVAGAGASATLSGGKFGTDFPVDLVGESDDRPLDTTTYKLTVKTSTGSIFVTVSRTVTAQTPTTGEGGGSGSGDFSAVTFGVSPTSVDPGTDVTITWDASSVPGATVELFADSIPISGGPWPQSGSTTYPVEYPITFSMTVIDPNGGFTTRYVRVSIGSTAGAFTSTGDWGGAPGFGVRE